jgi:hypothetical protein
MGSLSSHKERIFVFVVCGSREHIETLHYSLKALRHYSSKRIIVVTDNRRNEVSIEHNEIVDVRTDETYDHHQASIFLKTSLNQVLPKGPNYCYLDTDVVAMSSECDAIFEEFKAPIVFAPDHCSLKKFSAFAVNCACAEKWKQDRDLWEEKMNLHDRNRTITDEGLLKQSEELALRLIALNKSFLKRVLTALRYFSSLRTFKLDDEYAFNKKTREWKNHANKTVLFEVDVKLIERDTGMRFNRWKQKWYNAEGEGLWDNECAHLAHQIEETFKIDVKQENWQHWNGGVFLFNEESEDFMNAWHQKSVDIWRYPEWKLRDQGTLIATAWEFGLGNHKTLDKQWNFIADYYNQKLQLKEKKGLISDNGFKTSCQPVFMHVYHHFGNENWDVWKWVDSKVPSADSVTEQS